jgi:hypothetical protein
MRLKYLAAVFPVSLLGLMMAERLATFLVGVFPSKPALWAISIQLRSLFLDTSSFLAGGTMHSITLQLAVLAALGVLVLMLMRARSWPALAFLVNHGALLLVAAALLATGSTIASSGGSPLEPGHWLLANARLLDAFQCAVLLAGFAGCACCHYLFLTQRLNRDSVLAVALKELTLDLGRRRSRR